MSQDVVIFMVGGTTYEEARTVHLVNATQTETWMYLGGTIVQNSARLVTFLTYVFFNFITNLFFHGNK
ncbi:hypothetical protein M758_7G150200 [Ceratodon purpureus]|nr:hypothetical protein M758_7G150200 [Ceratodon purpureus]